MIDMWISFGEGFLLVFTIDNKESFENIKIKRDLVWKKKHNKKLPMILVGNNQELDNKWKVSYKEAKDLADSLVFNILKLLLKLDSMLRKYLKN